MLQVNQLKINHVRIHPKPGIVANLILSLSFVRLAFFAVVLPQHLRIELITLDFPTFGVPITPIDVSKG